LGIDDNEPSLTLEEKQARVIDLLKARSGIYHAALYETPAMKAEKPVRGSHPPRSFWAYNNWDFNALGTIYETATHDSIYHSFDERIARHIGMEDFSFKDQEYVSGAGAGAVRRSYLRSGSEKARQPIPWPTAT
jgi:CubicO group peptidase (beta-lactamase class C family)